MVLRPLLWLWVAYVSCALPHSRLSGSVYRELDMAREGCLGHGPVHLLVASAADIGFQWDPRTLGSVRSGLLVLSNLAGPIQHFKSAILDAWWNEVTVDLCARKGFRGGPLLDATGTLPLNSTHCSEVSWLVVFGTGSCWKGAWPACSVPGLLCSKWAWAIFFGGEECTFPPFC